MNVNSSLRPSEGYRRDRTHDNVRLHLCKDNCITANPLLSWTALPRRKRILEEVDIASPLSKTFLALVATAAGGVSRRRSGDVAHDTAGPISRGRR
jgi:hypothetical protein